MDHDAVKHVDAVAMYGRPRSSEWDRFRLAYLKSHPCCWYCDTSIDLDVHHIFPFHLYPERELDPTNVMTLCRRHHFELGHLRNWLAYNPDVEHMCAEYRSLVDNRPTARLDKGIGDHLEGCPPVGPNPDK